MKKILLALLSFFIPIVGIVLYFVYKPKNDAKLFGMLAVIAIALGIIGGLLA